ncbi:MAG: S-layer homology domain-containing protein, partial [Firmicutes bacterium]|nr:S-layer homology domain-containing protein [Bacillota bacterium]
LLRDEVLIDNQVLINYIVDNLNGVVGEEYAQAQGRINIINDKSAVDVASYFSDVNEGDWFVDHVKAAFTSDIIAGFHDGTYRPQGNLTHAQIMVMAANLHSKEKGDDYDFQANRKEGDAWYQVFEDYCVAEGIVPAETFGAGGPFEGKENENVTRAQMAFYFANTLKAESYAEKKEVALSDIEGHIFASEIEKLAKADIVGGYTDGTYRPENLVTRAEAAVFVHNILNAIAE